MTERIYTKPPCRNSRGVRAGPKATLQLVQDGAFTDNPAAPNAQNQAFGLILLDDWIFL